MQVDATTFDPAFQYVNIVRSGGITGAIERLRIDRDMNAVVHRWDGRAHNVDIDAAHAEDVLHALAKADTTPLPHSSLGCDVYNYDIELCWNGTVRRYHCTGLGADEALHGAVDLAETAFRHHIDTRTVPVRVGYDGAAAPNGNTGIVPPWLLDGTTPELTAR